MSLISALIIIAGRFIVKIFITVFGWAMVIFFGRIPEEKNKKLSVIALLSLVWVILIIGISYPALTDAFYDYIPDNKLKRMVSVLLETVGILMIPMIVGEISVFIQEKEKKEAMDFVKATIKGYYYSVVMGISMILMLLMAPFITLRRFIQRQEAASMPVLISDDRIRVVLGKLRQGLEKKGYQVLLRKPEWIMNFPVLLIRRMLKELLEKDITKNLNLQGEGFRISLNATDISIVGKKRLVDQIRIQLSMILSYDSCFMTWGEASQEIEKEAYFIYRSFKEQKSSQADAVNALENLKKKVDIMELEYEEWEIVSKKIAIFEIDVLQKAKE